MDIISQLKRDEAFRSHPYRDTVGKLTIGYGRNLDDVGVSSQEAEMMLVNDVNYAQGQLEQNLPWTGGLDECRRSALVNMVFNMGIGGLMQFKKALAAMQAQDWETAAMEMLNSQWANQVGPRAHRLAEEIRTGEWL